MAGPFDYVNSINDHKRMEVGKGYDQFLIAKHYSYFQDSILFANELNEFQDVSNKMHYEYLFNSLKKRKRFSKWFKPEQDENLKMVSEFYNYSKVKAAEALKVLTEENMKHISEWYNKKNNQGE